MGNEKLVITEAGFLTEFLNQHAQRTERPFCFILGAGVSRMSGIATGGEMAALWLREIYEAENFDGLALEEWATPERLGIPGFAAGKLASFYPQLYRRRYVDHEQAGYAFLESQMEGKEPSYGYSVLAYLLSETPHRVVVTTNFDNLVADALSIHSSRFPLVIGHDALAQYAAVELRRPLVAKIHGALGFSPKSQPDDIATLPEGWRTALQRILERYTPIVIGYEGNDGSLMGFLRSLPDHIPDRILWCVYAPDAKPTACLDRVSPEVRDYVRLRRGRFIPIRGFDELMAKLLSKLREKGSVPDLYERLKERARQRERNYDDQQRRLYEASTRSRPPAEARSASSTPRETDRALSEAVSEIAVSRKDKPWWVWSQEASAAPNDAAKEAILLQALEALPNDSDVLRTYGLFLEGKDDENKAKEFYLRAVEADPQNAMSLSFCATLLARSGDMNKAEEYYRRSIEADPSSASTLAYYAGFLERVRGDMNAAEEYYQRAVRAGPDIAYPLDGYAEFLATVRKDMNRAEEYYQRAVEAAPQNPLYLRSYANFLRTVRGDTEKANELAQRARAVEGG
jgi:protein O-mannosyl-transferase